MTESSFFDRVKALNLPLDRVIVIASGVMDVYGIRKADDIDLAADAELFASFKSNPEWQPQIAAWGEVYYRNKDCEVWSGWTEPDSDRPLYDDLLPYTVVLDGVRFMSLDYVRTWKLQKGRTKDIADVALIDAYNKDHD